MSKTYDSSFDRGAWRLAKKLRTPSQSRAGVGHEDLEEVTSERVSEPSQTKVDQDASLRLNEAAQSTTLAQDVISPVSDAEFETFSPEPQGENDSVPTQLDGAAPNPVATSLPDVARPKTKESALPEPPSLFFNQEGTFREQVWEALLQWGSESLTANWAYVSDASGLIIASHGKALGADAERITSNLFSAIGHLSECGGGVHAPKFVTFFVNGFWHAVFCHELEERREHWLLIGFTSRFMPAYKVLSHVRNVFRDRLQEL